MFITPMQKITSLDQASQIGITPIKDRQITPTGTEIFSTVFGEALNNVIETDKIVAKDVYNVTTGQSDDLHTLMLNQSKAQMSVQLLVEMRNRVMDSYSEIMRISL